MRVSVPFFNVRIILTLWVRRVHKLEQTDVLNFKYRCCLCGKYFKKKRHAKYFTCGHPDYDRNYQMTNKRKQSMTESIRNLDVDKIRQEKEFRDRLTVVIMRAAECADGAGNSNVASAIWDLRRNLRSKYIDNSFFSIPDHRNEHSVLQRLIGDGVVLYHACVAGKLTAWRLDRYISYLEYVTSPCEHGKYRIIEGVHAYHRIGRASNSPYRLRVVPRVKG